MAPARRWVRSPPTISPNAWRRASKLPRRMVSLLTKPVAAPEPYSMAMGRLSSWYVVDSQWVYRVRLPRNPADALALSTTKLALPLS